MLLAVLSTCKDLLSAYCLHGLFASCLLLLLAVCLPEFGLSCCLPFLFTQRVLPSLEALILDLKKIEIKVLFRWLKVRIITLHLLHPLQEYYKIHSLPVVMASLLQFSPWTLSCEFQSFYTCFKSLKWGVLDLGMGRLITIKDSLRIGSLFVMRNSA